MATIRRTTPTFPDYITYRFANRLVYVCPASTYETALDLAQKEFTELATVQRDRISFNTVATVNRLDARVVRISESAWLVAMARQLCGGVIDIFVAPDPSMAMVEPPTYLVAAGGEKEEVHVDFLKNSTPTTTPTKYEHSALTPTERRTSPMQCSKSRSWWLPRLKFD
ncbi:hypothetical protein FB45DRAFT_844720 [Roridomyces roridus]|uniref:Uncharacterized protein n=1 Tax=Roridomyces roridus TaxID=1738132 RepID=A0AAD7B477_9AGAR|nr:hypothetical protein FB45DRAFT_844720 [Roridomyces roridus]